MFILSTIYKEMLESGDSSIKYWYGDNKNLRDKHLVYHYTEDDMFIYKACKDDIFAFALTMEALPELSKSYFLHTLGENKLFILDNQVGEDKDKLFALYITHYITYNTDKVIQVLTPDKASQDKMFSLIKEYQEKLPFYLKSGITEWSDEDTKFRTDLNNYIHVGDVNDYKSYIGWQNHFVMLYDFHMLDDDYSNELYSNLFPVVSALRDSKFIITGNTEANGNQLYNDLVKKDNEYHKYILKL